MSRLVKVLRNKKKDDVALKPEPPKPKSNPKGRKIVKKTKENPTMSLSASVFTHMLGVFLDNKEVLKSLSTTNDEVKGRLMEFTKNYGIVDDKGHYIYDTGQGVVSKVQTSTSRRLNKAEVELLVAKLLKKKQIRKREADKIVNKKHTITLSDTAYEAMRAELSHWGAGVETNTVIDEDALSLLVANGIISMTDKEDLYEEEYKYSFVPFKLKQED